MLFFKLLQALEEAGNVLVRAELGRDPASPPR